MQTNKGLSDSVIFLEKRHPENVIMYFFYKKSPKKNSTLKTILVFFGLFCSINRAPLEKVYFKIFKFKNRFWIKHKK